MPAQGGAVQPWFPFLALGLNGLRDPVQFLRFTGERMNMDRVESDEEPMRAAIGALQGQTVLEFGTSWCGYCRAAQPLIARALAGYSKVRHIKIEDNRGRRLGRSFGVKLWPTLVFLRDGKEVARLVRPADSEAIQRALAGIGDKPGDESGASS